MPVNLSSKFGGKKCLVKTWTIPGDLIINFAPIVSINKKRSEGKS